MVTEQRNVALTVSVGVTVCWRAAVCRLYSVRDEAMYLKLGTGAQPRGMTVVLLRPGPSTTTNQPATRTAPGGIGAALRRGGLCGLPTLAVAAWV